MTKATGKRASASVYQLKITLRDTKPPIWRRFLVRGEERLDELHRIVQTVMGWCDGHLHQFVVGTRVFASKDAEVYPRAVDERTVTLDQVLRSVGERMRYDYDFGDGWEHDIELEQVSAAPADVPLPWMVTGKQRCPPEDCGGVFGYYELLKILRDPKHADHAELLEHHGPIDPAEFRPDDLNLAVHGRRLDRKARPAAQVRARGKRPAAGPDSPTPGPTPVPAPAPTRRRSRRGLRRLE